MKKNVQLLLVLLMGIAWLLPTTFSEYRTLVFQTMPLDDYRGYVAYVATSGAEGEIPGSPFKERIFNIIPMAGLFKLLPVIPLTNAAGTPDWFMKASFAISFMNSLSFLLAAAVVFVVATKFLNDKRVAVLSSLFLLVCSNHVGMTGVDGIAVLVIALALLFHINGNLKTLTVTILASILINEKILIFSIGYFFIYALSNRKDAFVWAVSLISFLVYLVLRKYYGVGNEGQLDVGKFFGAFLATTQWSFTVKGLYLNVFPLMVILLPMFFFLFARGRANHYGISPGACFLSIAALLVAAMAADLVYTAGRVVMYAAPVVSVFFAMLFDTDPRMTEHANDSIADRAHATHSPGQRTGSRDAVI